MKKLTKEKTEKFQKTYDSNKSFQLLRRALVKNSINDISLVLEANRETKYNFSIELETLPVNNQGATGRCWLFAGLNVLREKAAKKFNVANLEFSQSYQAFWDKYEKINFFIQSMDDFLNVDVDDRTLKFLLSQGIQDGGQWDMFVNLVNKYGVVPKDAMPDTYSGGNSRYLNKLINIQLRKYAQEARELYQQDKEDLIEELKDKTLSNLYGLLVNALGVPPKEFAFEYTDKNKKYNLIKNLTPQSFYESIGTNLNEYVSIINAPTDDKPFNKNYTVAYLGNVIGGKEINHLNLEMERVTELIIKQLKDGEVVWFGCDTTNYSNDFGIWNDNAFEFNETFEMDFNMSKKNRLDYLGGTMNHAMIITGVNLDDNYPTKWKIANSWGEQRGDKGYYLMTNSWHLEHTYQAVVHKKYLTENELKAYNDKPVVLKPWDPMGALA